MNSYRKGIFSGLLSGLLWGADTAFNGWVLLAVPFSLVDKRLVAASLLLAFFHDLFSALYFTIQTQKCFICNVCCFIWRSYWHACLFICH